MNELGSMATPGTARRVAAVGDLAYVCVQESGVLTVDAGDSANLQLVSALSLTGDTMAVAVEDDRAVIANGWAGIVIAAVSPTGVLTPVASSVTRGFAQSVVLKNKVVYVGDRFEGVSAIDTSDPYNPRLIGFLPGPGTSQQVCLIGDRVFVADGIGGLMVASQLRWSVAVPLVGNGFQP